MLQKVFRHLKLMAASLTGLKKKIKYQKKSIDLIGENLHHSGLIRVGLEFRII